MLRYHLETEVRFAVDTMREYNFKYFICWNKSNFIPLLLKWKIVWNKS